MLILLSILHRFLPGEYYSLIFDKFRNEHSLSSPSSIDSVGSTSYLTSVVAAEESSQGSDIFGSSKRTWRLLIRNQYIAGLIVWNLFLFSNNVNLLLNERSEDKPRADCIDCDSWSCVFESCSLSEANDSVLGSNIRWFVHRCNQTMYTCDVDDSSPFSLLHPRQSVSWSVEGWAEVEWNNFLPNLLREVFNLADMLHTCIVHKDIDLAEMGDRLLD